MYRNPSSVADLIRLWPSQEQFGDDLALKWRSHGRVMRVRNSIPRARWNAVVEAARKRGIEGVSIEVLEKLHASRPPRSGLRAGVTA
jgi:hypothetical protein